MDDFDFLDDELFDEDDIDFNDLPLDDEFIRTHFNTCDDGVIENFPFIEDDVDAITDYELFSRGFGYLDEKKADKTEIPDVSVYAKKDEISKVGFTGKYNDLLNKPTLFSGDYNDLTNKPTIPSKTSDLNNDSGFIDKDVNDLTNYPLTSSLSSVAFSGDYDDLSDKPTIPDVSNFITKDVNDLTYYTKTSDLATVATSGDYDDLLDKPTIPDVSNFITKDVNDLTYYTKTSDLSSVATSGNYNDLSNKPTIPTVPTNVSAFNNDSGYITKSVNDLTNYTTTTALTSLLGNKEDSIEKGSNANGYYMKFNDGTMIQWNDLLDNTFAITSTYGSLYQGVKTYNFPVAFTEVPTCVLCSRAKWGSGASWGTIDGFTKTTLTVRAIDILSRATGTNVAISWLAIGRWK